MTDQDKRNVYQRLCAVAAKLDAIEPTGKSQFKADGVFSIQDVENAIRDALTAEGVITRWSFQTDGLDMTDAKLWKAKLRVTVVNADNPDDQFVDEWEDIGNSPAAACSYAAKGYYKRLFHIAQDEEDDAMKGNHKTAQSPQNTAPVPPIETKPVLAPKPTPMVKANGSDRPRDDLMTLMHDLAHTVDRPAGDLLKQAINECGTATDWYKLSPDELGRLTVWAQKQLREAQEHATVGGRR